MAQKFVPRRTDDNQGGWADHKVYEVFLEFLLLHVSVVWILAQNHHPEKNGC